MIAAVDLAALWRNAVRTKADLARLSELVVLIHADGGRVTVLPTATADVSEKVFLMEHRNFAISVVSSTHHADPQVANAVRAFGARCRESGIDVIPTRRSLIDLTGLRRAARQAAHSSDLDRADSRERRLLVSADIDFTVEIERLLVEARDRRASDLNIVVTDDVTMIEFTISGVVVPIKTESVNYGQKLLSALFSAATDHSRSSDDVRSHISAVMARDSEKFPLPPGIEGVRCQWVAIAFGFRDFTARLHYSGVVDPNVSLSSLGFTLPQVDAFRRLRSRNAGVTLLSGPTGSGKTTTLAALVMASIAERPWWMRYELSDPPEIVLQGVRQVAIANADTPQKKAEAAIAGLAALLRSAPHQLIVGELREAVMATMALEAAATGHQVFSTVHAGTAAGILGRLSLMSVPSWLIFDPTIINGLVAQRLVGKLCPSCKVPLVAAWHDLTDGAADDVKRVKAAAAAELLAHAADKRVGVIDSRLFLERSVPEQEQILSSVCVAGKGCRACKDTGYAARTIIAEIIETDGDFMEAYRVDGKVAALKLWVDGGGIRMIDNVLGGLVAGQLDAFDYRLDLASLRVLG